MPIVIRYQCHACGAPSEPHGETWSRCTFCRALLGLDIQAWRESADYRRWLAGAATLGERFRPYQALEAEAEKLFRAGHLEEAVSAIPAINSIPRVDERESNPPWRPP